MIAVKSKRNFVEHSGCKETIFYSLSNTNFNKLLINPVLSGGTNVLVSFVQAILVIRGDCVPANRHVYRKRVKRETCKCP
jgi:hypothetical protein